MDTVPAYQAVYIKSKFAAWSNLKLTDIYQINSEKKLMSIVKCQHIKQ